jgi:4-oxalomesaconate hydratase
LVFSAHVADFCSRSGGTIARYTRDGADVRVVCLTRGERSESGGLFRDGAKPDLKSVGQVRQEELDHAAEILGVEASVVGWDDLGFGYTPENVRRLAEEVRAFSPDLILTHHGPDPRSVDHDITYQLAVRAAQVAGAPGLESAHPARGRVPVFLFEATIPLTELEGFCPNLYIDITDVWDTKVAALKAFGRAQGFLLEWYTDVARHRASQAQRLCGRSDILYAEAFESTSPWVGRALPLNGL